MKAEMKPAIALSPLETYQVIDRKEGGMGQIYILKRVSEQPLPPLYKSRRLQDEFKFIYRDVLAAKAVKSTSLESQFLRELNIWITLKPAGVVPLLKVVREGQELLGIMPAYESNLREYLLANRGSGSKCLQFLRQTVKGLDEVSKSGVLHLDLKPENLLVTMIDNEPQIDVADWGIANVKMELARATNQPEGDIATIVGAGTIPYMSPERFSRSKPDIRADVFSLGVIFYEMLLGELPYDRHEPCDLQIRSGKYMDRVRKMVDDQRLPPLVAKMLQPDMGKRTSSYEDILRFLESAKG
jgi:serine/threonine protein kinase